MAVPLGGTSVCGARPSRRAGGVCHLTGLTAFPFGFDIGLRVEFVRRTLLVRFVAALVGVPAPSFLVRVGETLMPFVRHNDTSMGLVKWTGPGQPTDALRKTPQTVCRAQVIEKVILALTIVI
jgi:hypothetical protein